MVRISVVVPCYEHEQFVEAALRSVMAQDYAEIELVVVDDGSRDDTAEVIERTLKDAACPVSFVRQDNAGTPGAIARGVELATGDVIALLNSDDLYEPTRLSELARRFPASSEFLLFSGVRVVDELGHDAPVDAVLARWYTLALIQASQCPTVGYGLLCNNFAVSSGNLVFSRALYDRVGGFRDAFRFCHDWDFILRCMRWTEPLFVPQALTCYRLHGGNTIGGATGREVDEEFKRLLSDYLRACEKAVPNNPLAPCRAHWPAYFGYFIQSHSRYDSLPIAELIDDPGLYEPPPAAGAGWRPWSDGVVQLPRGEDLGQWISNEEGASDPQTWAFVRELALVRRGLHERYGSIAAPARSSRRLLEWWERLWRSGD